MTEDFRLRREANVMLEEFLPSGERFYIPDGTTQGGKDGLIVTFSSGTNHQWTGVFAFGMNGNLRTRAIVPLPQSDRVLVVSDGDGFIVSESIPGEFQTVRSIPVRSVHVIESCEVVVLADDTTLVAYGKDGIAWETGRIAWHELRVDDVSDEEIICTTFDIRRDKDVSFTVDAATGVRHGGIEVP